MEEYLNLPTDLQNIVWDYKKQMDLFEEEQRRETKEKMDLIIHEFKLMFGGCSQVDLDLANSYLNEFGSIEIIYPSLAYLDDLEIESQMTTTTKKITPWRLKNIMDTEFIIGKDDFFGGFDLQMTGDGRMLIIIDCFS